MNARLLLAITSSSFLAMGFCEAKTGSTPWSHEGSDIAPDAAVTWGALPNGLRYAIMPHDDPPGRVSLRLYVDAGSLMEEDDQQGLAHFTEHMAFNGTKNFPAGQMVEYFQRLGMAFGADTNAHTSFKETVYKLDLPRTDDELLGESMRLLRDYADGMVFAEAEIDKERGVILSEKLSRDSVDYRTFVESLKFNLPNSLISRRLPIGTEEAIASAPRQRFLDFYRKYYTPDRMVFVAAGDIDPGAIAALVEEHFGSMERNGDAVADPDLGEVTSQGVAVLFHPEEEASASYILIETMKPFTKGSDSQARRAEELRQGLAHRIVARRLDILSKEVDAPFISGSASSSDMVNFVTMGTVQLTAKPENWREALFTAEQELRRAVEHGFTQAELDESRANVRQSYERRAETAATRKSRDLADALVSRISDERVFTSPLDDLPRVSAELDAVTREECLGAFRELWGGADLQVFVSGNIEMSKAAGKKAVLEAFHESRAKGVEAPVEEEVKSFAYADEREPGEITSRERIEDLELIQVKFANGVRLNLKKTDFEEETIRITVRFGGGKLTIPWDKAGLGIFADNTFTAGGLEAHSADDLKRIFAGRTVAASFSIEDDAFVLSGQTKPEDFLNQLQLMAAYLEAPGYRKEAEDQFKRGIDAIYAELEHTPMGVLENEVSHFVHGGDGRFGYPDKEILLQRNSAEAREWLGDPLAKGYLEISIVGDFENDAAAIEKVARTFGSLPTRQSSKPKYAKERIVAYPRGIDEKVFSYVSEIPKSMIMAYWKTGDMWDIKRSRRLNILASVMRDRLRLKIREELGEAYSPYARSETSDAFTDFGYLVAMVESDREKAQEIGGILREIGEDLKAKGVTEDELERAKEPLLNMLKEYRRNNSYWMQSVLMSSQEHPQRLDWARSIIDDYGDVSVKEVNALAKEFLGKDAALRVLIVSRDGESG